MSSPLATDLARWERLHAVWMLLGTLMTVVTGKAGYLLGISVGSFAFLLLAGRGRYCPRPGFGVANTITLLRVVATLAVLVLPALLAWQVALALLLILGLDAADGAVARRRGEHSEFGAHFDVSGDAFLVLTTTLLLYLRGIAGEWVLLAGSLRFLFVVVTWAFPPRRPDLQRANFARFSYALMMGCLLLAFVMPSPWAALLCALGTVATCASFALSFKHRYSRSAP